MPIVTAELLVHLQHGFVAAEVEQAIQRVLDVPDIATAGAQMSSTTGLYWCTACC